MRQTEIGILSDRGLPLRQRFPRTTATECTEPSGDTVFRAQASQGSRLCKLSGYVFKQMVSLWYVMAMNKLRAKKSNFFTDSQSIAVTAMAPAVGNDCFEIIRNLASNMWFQLGIIPIEYEQKLVV